ncbi:hypothetical protein [Nocardioides solisilvae]|uniref:hypothetical protein n=1 Tax=Nocardioides solisilvae TaxID=1542435 RepID=UPI000D74E66F|nr:hypothetical protein [Nocardioides solisilvae]
MSRRVRRLASTPVAPVVAPVAALLVALLALTACGADDPVADDPTPSAPTSPTAVPAAEGEVTTLGPVLVLDQGDQPVACLGGAAESLPPQCEGTRLEGWEWEEHPEHESTGGVRWGDFALTGTWDGTVLEVTEAVPAAGYDGEWPGDETPGTPCPEPAGGWQVEDPARTSGATLDEVLRRAGQLPGYAEAWLDTNDITKPEETVVNVRVTQDVARAEKTLRRTWGGPLCVQEARFTEDELVALTTDLQELPGVLDSSAFGDVVALTVLHDDGSIQAWVDAEHGDGRIEVRPVLVPVTDEEE